MSEWSISKAEVALLFILLGNEGQVCLPRWQDTFWEDKLETVGTIIYEVWYDLDDRNDYEGGWQKQQK